MLLDQSDLLPGTNCSRTPMSLSEDQTVQTIKGIVGKQRHHATLMSTISLPKSNEPDTSLNMLCTMQMGADMLVVAEETTHSPMDRGHTYIARIAHKEPVPGLPLPNNHANGSNWQI